MWGTEATPSEFPSPQLQLHPTIIAWQKCRAFFLPLRQGTVPVPGVLPKGILSVAVSMLLLFRQYRMLVKKVEEQSGD